MLLAITPNSTHAALGVHAPGPQAQIMMMMTEAFSKLIMDFTETKTTNLKANQPIFDGTKSKFQSWYLTFLSQVSVPPWCDLYDTATNYLVSSMSNTSLNAKFYSKRLLVLKGEALSIIDLQKHL